MTVQEFLRTILQPIPASFWLLLGSLIAVLIRRYSNRMVTLRWTVTTTPMAISEPQRVEIRYLGRPVGHLFLSRIIIRNDSSRDLENMVATVTCSEHSVVLDGRLAVQGSANDLQLTAEYLAEIHRVIQLNEEQSAQDQTAPRVVARRDFAVPVFNRHQEIQGALLITNASALPVLNITVDHLGVKTVESPQRQLLWGLSQAQATYTGLVLVLLGAWPLARTVGNHFALAYLAVLLTSIGSILGWLFLKLFFLIKRHLL